MPRFYIWFPTAYCYHSTPNKSKNGNIGEGDEFVPPRSIRAAVWDNLAAVQAYLIEIARDRPDFWITTSLTGTFDNPPPRYIPPIETQPFPIGHKFKTISQAEFDSLPLGTLVKWEHYTKLYEKVASIPSWPSPTFAGVQYPDEISNRCRLCSFPTIINLTIVSYPSGVCPSVPPTAVPASDKLTNAAPVVPPMRTVLITVYSRIPSSTSPGTFNETVVTPPVITPVPETNSVGLTDTQLGKQATIAAARANPELDAATLLSTVVPFNNSTIQ